MNRVVNLRLEYEAKSGGADICKAMEKKDFITGAIYAESCQPAKKTQLSR